ncbi:MAG: hypothetical protein HZB42_09190 [Sphingobacteriales bacterium]|nr:hypothetical protein [Sphingobacteriales bacterium]
MQKKIVNGFIFIMTVVPGVAQRQSKQFEAGVGLAGLVYQGDLTPNSLGSFKTMKPGLVLSAAKIMSASFLLRLNIAFGGLKGDETKYDNPEYRKFRAFKFHSPVFEVSPQLVWNPLGKNFSEKGFSPYLFSGAAISHFNIKRDYSGFDAEYFGDGSDIPARLALDEQHSLPKLRFIIPVGIGIRYNLSDRLAINAEESYRFLFTDYLDGFSKAANPDHKDHFHSSMIGLVYRIGKKNTLGCPAVRH